MRNVTIPILGILIILVFALQIDVYNKSFLIQNKAIDTNTDLLYKVFGELSNYLSYLSYMKADNYFHGGVYLADKDECLDKISDAEHAHAHEHEHAERVMSSTGNLLLDIHNNITISEHKHLKGVESKEIIPWLYYSVKLNPHNQMAYSVAGYWLAVKMNDFNAGALILNEGLRNNPESWQIYSTLGQIYFEVKKDYQKASEYFESAVLYNRSTASRSDDMDIYNKRVVFGFLINCYSKLGMKDKAEALKAQVNRLLTAK